LCISVCSPFDSFLCVYVLELHSSAERWNKFCCIWAWRN